jgi:hypothetical protein
MSKPLTVVVPHSLGKKEALHQLRLRLSKAAASFRFRVCALEQAVRGLAAKNGFSVEELYGKARNKNVDGARSEAGLAERGRQKGR